jgi:uncharacterized membrane protein YeaQ/YmgE (transglycosylase-associated protein family)
MNLAYFAVYLVVAIVCAGIANVLVPRRIPGKFLGLMLVGILGVWLGDLGFKLLHSQYRLDFAFLHWDLLGVPVIPSIIGSAIVLYVVTTFLKWGRYNH